MKKLDVLLLADLHYAGAQTLTRPCGSRKCFLGLELAIRALCDALRSGKPDLVCLLGDLVELGTAPGAMEDLRQLADSLSKFGIPILAVPGNHDRYPERVAQIFGGSPGLHQVGEYDFVLFHDRYDEHEVGTRPPEQSAFLASSNAGRPLVVLQHNPVLPPIESDYPYTIAQAEDIAEQYRRAGVFLSISGHYHAGLPPLHTNGTTYVVCPALCEYPYRYVRLTLEGHRIVALREVPLALPEFGELIDAHVHTEFAYCASDITIAGTLVRADAFKLGLLGLCEHGDQLYFPRDNFWSRSDINHRVSILRAVQEGHSRHAVYRNKVAQLPRARVRLGLEVEHDEEGDGIAGRPEDLAGYDYLIGSIHYVTRGADSTLAQKEAERAFWARTKQLVRSGISVLGHPFRYFRRHNRSVPADLFKPVADLLAQHTVAAEINFHGDEPSPEFLSICVSRGVKLAIGTDAHSLVEVGDLKPHVDLLRSLGV
ncbi:MAG: metallophosphoesterase, partial [Kiritimatiellia bacterium]